ncbi:type II toxin-antitoxin system VapC family toxin [Streptomyces nymphaeiformis]|uniref:Putative nucleic acid-binding protein n=1 Tax=Streptomyces nymphaeiformis TaxID=2663842 RepID=A0A7W7U521_9ACTN|nr:PIN domain-containing protein [Streptomyces nymphaeiformis]MBB4984776.1 putative nucleic acid-binding protein [Streptomyces nymphaeiformis]
MEKSRSQTIIADTSGLVSLFHPLDSNHALAVKAAEQLQDSDATMLVPIAVYLELLNILGRIMGHEIAARVAEELSDHFVILNNISSASLLASLKIFSDVPSGVSHTDCLVMASCDEYGTSDIFGFDKAFVRLGYRIIT